MERQYVLSERAHFLWPNMFFGIVAKIEEEYDIEKIKMSLDALANAHPFLKSKMSFDGKTTKLFYDTLDKSMISISEKKNVDELYADYDYIRYNDWDVLKEGLLKVLLYKTEEGFKALFVAHHLLVDGRGLLAIVEEFANMYVNNEKPLLVEECLIKSIADLPLNSDLKGISNALVNSTNKKFAKENSVVSYEENKKFVKDFVSNNPVKQSLISLQASAVKNMRLICRENNVSINDLLMARLYRSALIKKIIIALDIRDHLHVYRKNSLGNYSTAVSVIVKNNKLEDFELANVIHKSVQKIKSDNRKLMLVLACYLRMNPDLIDAAAISSLQTFPSKAARFVGDMMFGFKKRDGQSITNLGAIENDNIKELVFIPPISPATIQTIGVVTLNGVMSLCSSYYEKSIKKEEVEKILSSLVKEVK